MTFSLRWIQHEQQHVFGSLSLRTTLSPEYQLWMTRRELKAILTGLWSEHLQLRMLIEQLGKRISNRNRPLGQVSMGKIFISLHSYMGYSSSNWNNAARTQWHSNTTKQSSQA